MHFICKPIPKCLEYLVSITLGKGFYNIDVDGVQGGLQKISIAFELMWQKKFLLLTELSNFDLSTNFLYYFSEKQIQDD